MREITLMIATPDGERPVRTVLADHPPARDLLSRLPLSLRFRDFNGVEKIAALPQPLTTDGVPAGAAPAAGDIGFYSPSGDLVLYYGDVDYWPGIVVLGRYDADAIALVASQQDGVEVTVTTDHPRARHTSPGPEGAPLT